jgi:LPXTG-motif cell wall-anchored protein
MKKALLAASVVALTVGGLAPVGLTAAGADPVDEAFASAFGANVDLAGEPIVDQFGLATATVPPGQDVGPNAEILVPVEPVAVSGTAVGEANAHVASDINSDLAQPDAAGPYNARGVGFVENLAVLLQADVATLPVELALVSATAVRGEAVGVCRNGAAEYSATSEIVDLRLGGEPVDAVNDLVGQLIDTVDGVLQPLSAVVDLEQNIVTRTADGISVDALRVTVLGAIAGVGVQPAVDIVVGHAEVGGLVCAAANVPECSDGADNDGDGVIDAQDPGCLTPDGVFDPNDDDERNECIDGVDNDGDGRIDFPDDPGCSSPQDDDERDGGGRQLARTGGTSSTAPIAFGLMALAIGAMAVRRRSLA